MIEIKHITKSYGSKTVLKDISLNFNSGIIGLLGPNGAGKTTLLRIMATVTEASSGEILFDGKSVIGKKLREKIGYLPQQFSFYRDLSVYESLEHIAYMKEIEKNKIHSQIDKCLERVNLEDRKKTKVGTLSGGMLRRLGIAQALLGDPEVILVDEPTAGLDPEERIRFRELLFEMKKERLVFISTHIVGDIEGICDDLVIMNEGMVLLDGNYKDVINKIENRLWIVHSKSEFIEIDGLVISKTKSGDTYAYKVISDNKPNDGTLITPSLEDLYIFCLKRNVIS
ncbi:MAG: ABC transporter ATP-binding protein [Lachnospiraceae bacterium]|nr:ABC transporter ATP-binding protein [Lachnospiraceae bacterium]